MRRIIASLIVSAALPILVFAQRAGVSAGAAHVAAPPVAAHVAAPSHAAPAGAHPVNVSAHGSVRLPASHVHPAGTVHSNVRSNVAINTAHRVPSPANPVVATNNVRANDSFPVPGLGFDYTHFFATHPNFGKNHRTTGFILPFFGGGLYVPYPYYTDPPTPEEEAEGYDPDAGQRIAEATPSTGANDAVSAVRTNTYTPVQPQSEYVFVRRDGTVFFAIAYSWGTDKLQYVTKEGAHRTVASDTIDLDATQQFNEQRGISIRLPA
jgi:hypothetical protein